MAAAPPLLRDSVQLDWYLGIDERSIARKIRTPRHAASTASTASVRRRRGRRWLAAGAGLPLVAFAAATARSAADPAQRIEVMPDGPALPTVGLPPMPPIAVALADGRILRVDPTGTVAAIDLGTMAHVAGALAPGSVHLSATNSELYAGRSTEPGSIVAFGGGWHGGVVATGHSPAISRDGRAAWIEVDPAGREAVAVSRNDGVEHLVMAADPGQPAVRLRSLSWSPSGARLAVEAEPAGGSPNVRIVDLSRDDGTVTSRKIATGRAPRWLPDGTVTVVDTSGTSVRIIDPDSGASVARPIIGSPAAAVDTDSRGDLLVVHDDGTLTVGGRPLLSSVAAAVWQQ
jgi:hypothetical protein